MRLEAVELRRANLELVSPFRTANGVETARDVLLVRVFTSSGEGWGECVAQSEPGYSSEYTAAAHRVMVEHLVPRLFCPAAPRAAGPGAPGGAAEEPGGGTEEPGHLSATNGEVGRLLAPVRGHRMAKAALEMALLDAELTAAGRSLACFLGATRSGVGSGVAVGAASSLTEMLDEVAMRVSQGYRRVKLKIMPGHDVEPVRAVRERYPDLALQVDANGSYPPSQEQSLLDLDGFGLLMIEQPFAPDALLAHARLASKLETPVCLDETITSATVAADAIALGACSVVNVKAGRVGGYLEARRVHDTCRSLGVPVWCGGMLETSIGRAANLALAALPGFTLPADISATDRYYRGDIGRGFALEGGRIEVPVAPGIGAEVDLARLDGFTASRELLRPAP
ncbi:MAG: o-succinylbenzoate synthase [Acidimicrobiales bacterium]